MWKSHTGADETKQGQLEASEVYVMVLARVVIVKRNKPSKVAIAVAVTRWSQAPEGTVWKKEPPVEKTLRLVMDVKNSLVPPEVMKYRLQGMQKQPQKLHHAGASLSELSPQETE